MSRFASGDRLTAAALNAAFADLEGLKPEDYGAKGDGVTDDSAAFARLWDAATTAARPIQLGAATYLIDATMLPPVVSKYFVLRGYGSGVTTIQLGPNYRGPALAFSETLRDNLPGGAIYLADFSIAGPLVGGVRDSSVPLGAQSGIMFFDRHDFPILENVYVRNIRGVGLSIGQSLNTNVGYARETAWFNVWVYNCGGNAQWPNVEILSNNSTSDQTNNLTLVGCRFCFSQGPNLRIESQDGKKSGGTTNIIAPMIHGRNTAFDPDTARAGWDLLEFNGEIANINVPHCALIASQVGQYLVSFKNNFRYNVTLPIGSIATTSGSAVVTITAPALPTRSIAAADIMTTKGSPRVVITWPAHGFSVGDWLTFDSWSGATRTAPVYDLNGAKAAGEMRVSEVLDADSFAIRLKRGYASITGTVNTTGYGSARTLRRTYGVISNASTISWGTWSRGVFTVSELEVNGIAFNGNKLLTTVGGPNVWQFTGTSNASATGTYGVETTVEMFSNMGDPQLINLAGRSNSGENGINVVRGQDLVLTLPTPTRGVDFATGPNIRGDIIYTAETRETAYNFQLDSGTAWLVSGAMFPSAALPARADVQSLGIYRTGQSFSRQLWARSTGNATRRLTRAGTQSLTAENIWTLPEAGSYAVTGSVVARQTGGTSGTAGDSATWHFTALLSWDGTTGNVVVDMVNGSAANVGVGLPPNETRGASTSWTITLTADATYDGLAITASGQTDKIISWNGRLMRMDAYQS